MLTRFPGGVGAGRYRVSPGSTTAMELTSGNVSSFIIRAAHFNPPRSRTAYYWLVSVCTHVHMHTYIHQSRKWEGIGIAKITPPSGQAGLVLSFQINWQASREILPHPQTFGNKLLHYFMPPPLPPSSGLKSPICIGMVSGEPSSPAPLAYKPYVQPISLLVELTG